ESNVHDSKTVSGNNHSRKSSTLTASISDCARGEYAGAARLLAENCRPLARTPGSRRDQGLLHSCCALSFTRLDGDKSATVERDQFPSSTRDTRPNSRC